MRSIKLHLLLMPMICMSMIDVFGQSGTKASEKATNYLKKFRSDYRSSMLNNKPELLQVFFAENIRLMPPFQKTIIGKVNALSYHKSIFSRFTIQDFTRNEIEILDLGSQVMETGILTLRLTSKETGKEEVLAGKYLNFWEEMK